MEYTKEQQEDIIARITKAAELLKELQLAPDAYVSKEPIGPGLYVDKVHVFLGDLKYAKPIQEEKGSEPATVSETSSTEKAGSDNKA